MDEAQRAAAYIKSKYLIKIKDKSKKIYDHVTVATDERNMIKVFEDVQQVVINAALASRGLI